ncbi:MAG: hypothetical protein K2Y14_11805 [Burkholderiales bacterium]|jgi:hypothetical protein|nr:hypothetical protein [Burkholderiales bacterium]
MNIEFYSDIISKNLTTKNKEYLKNIYLNNGDWLNAIQHILKYYNSKPVITNLSIKVAQEIFINTNKRFFPILIKCYKLGGSYNSMLLDENLEEVYLGCSPSIFLLLSEYDKKHNSKD